MKYFQDVKTLDELKAAYRKLAMLHHPDRGGSTEVMQAINAEYEKLFQTLKEKQNMEAANDETGKAQRTTESAADFINIISALLRIDGITVELCGRWLWIGGNTFANREALKAAGCKYSSKKRLWSWHYPEDGTFHRKRGSTMEYIRNRYGSEIFTSGSAEAIA